VGKDKIELQTTTPVEEAVEEARALFRTRPHPLLRHSSLQVVVVVDLALAVVPPHFKTE
jgi:hypothetical protein